MLNNFLIKKFFCNEKLDSPRINNTFIDLKQTKALPKNSNSLPKNFVIFTLYEIIVTVSNTALYGVSIT